MNGQNQMGLFSGAELKELGQEKTLEAEHEGWKSAVEKHVRELGRGTEFCSDALQAKLWAPHHPNCWGAMFSRLAKGGLIEQIGWVRSARVSRHAGAIGLWRRR